MKLSDRFSIAPLAIAAIISAVAPACAADTTTQPVDVTSSLTLFVAKPTSAAASLMTPQGGAKMRLMTANILLASPAYKGLPQDWEKRKNLCISTVKKQAPDIFCTQETLRVQAKDLAAAFPDFASFGFDGPEQDAFPDADYHGITKNVIFYRKDRFEMVSAGGYWLSETPQIAGSQSWDTMRPRHANWLRLRDKKTGHQFRVVDTHFDHKGKIGRIEQAGIINRDADQYQPDFPQLLLGDLNATQETTPILTLKSRGWVDTWALLHGPKDPGRTVHGYQGEAYVKSHPGGKIDYIMARGPVKALASEIVKDHAEPLYPSDHYFVWADLEL